MGENFERGPKNLPSPDEESKKPLPPLVGAHFSSEDPFSNTKHKLENRGDTVAMPSGSMGTLLSRAEKEGIEHRKVFDATFPGEQITIEAIEKEVDTLIKPILEGEKRPLEPHEKPRVFASLLSYNAEATLRFLEQMKAKYGDNVITGVGGQLVGRATKAYINNPAIDVVGVGDAELILRPMMEKYQDQSPNELRDSLSDEKLRETLEKSYPGFSSMATEEQQPLVERERIRELSKGKVVVGWLAEANKRREKRELQDFEPAKYDLPSYDPAYYAFIEERKKEMPQVKIGSGEKQVSGMVMLLTEFGRQCDWAGKNTEGACSFCALCGVEDPRNFQEIDIYFDHLSELKKQHPEMNWVFDVSNQLLEQNTSKATRFLDSYVEEKKKHPELADVKTYAYLTVNNVSDKTAPKLKQAGIEVAYVGIESFDPDQWKVMNKGNNPTNTQGCLEAAKEHGIKIRTSLVLGINSSEASLQKEISGLREALDQYPEVFLTVGFHPVEMIPGSRDFDEFRRENELLYSQIEGQSNGEAEKLYDHFYEKGFLNRDQQVALTEAFVYWRSRVAALEKDEPEFGAVFRDFIRDKKPVNELRPIWDKQDELFEKRLSDPNNPLSKVYKKPLIRLSPKASSEKTADQIKEELYLRFMNHRKKLRQRKESESTLGLDREQQKEYILERLRKAQDENRGITFEKIREAAAELNKIAREHGVAGYDLEHGDITS